MFLRKVLLMPNLVLHIFDRSGFQNGDFLVLFRPILYQIYNCLQIINMKFVFIAALFSYMTIELDNFGKVG